MPFFSIIIPTYNRADLLCETLNSFVKQTFLDFEVIVVDDGGKDDSRGIVENLQDTRFQYYWKENGERGAARNYGATLAKGEWLNFFDSDDVAYPEHLSIAYGKIKKNTEIKLFCLGQESRDINGKLYFKTKNSSEYGNNAILETNFVNPNSIFIYKALWLDSKYSENRELSGSEDWLFILLLSLKHKFYTFLDDITNCLIQHPHRSMSIASGISTERRGAEMTFELESKEVPAHIVLSVKAEMYSLAALYYALQSKKGDALRCLWEAFMAKNRVILKRRILAVVKYIVLK